MKNKFKTASIFLFFILLFIDQLTKYLIRSKGGFYFCNSGVAFGIKINPLAFWAAIFFILLIFGIYFLKNGIKSKLEDQNAIILISAGGAGNLIDRLRFGCITDFINLKIWPSFNLADAFIAIGAILILAKYFKRWYNTAGKRN